jgi:hypothetical protein
VPEIGKGTYLKTARIGMAIIIAASMNQINNSA